jgi:hypothetical protein
MGGMFSVVKVREGLARDNYSDPGWYGHPPGTVAREVAETQSPPVERVQPNPPNTKINMNIVKPKAKGHRDH